MVKYKLDLNLENLKVDQKAVFEWREGAPQAHYGMVTQDNKEYAGYPWIDLTHQRIEPVELMAADITKSQSIQEAFIKAANNLSQEYQSTLDQAPKDSIFDYQAIKDSASLEFQ